MWREVIRAPEGLQPGRVEGDMVADRLVATLILVNDVIARGLRAPAGGFSVAVAVVVGLCRLYASLALPDPVVEVVISKTPANLLSKPTSARNRARCGSQKKWRGDPGEEVVVKAARTNHLVARA